jgi:hypothetical protein
MHMNDCARIEIKDASPSRARSFPDESTTCIDSNKRYKVDMSVLDDLMPGKKNGATSSASIE